MPKIKDNIDLEELKKFGFELNSDEWYFKDCDNANIYVKPISRKIIMKSYDRHEIECIDILYDLIQEGFIEKVEN